MLQHLVVAEYLYFNNLKLEKSAPDAMKILTFFPSIFKERLFLIFKNSECLKEGFPRGLLTLGLTEKQELPLQLHHNIIKYI